jgi:tRNA-specific 2-thiouridylase
MSGGVDSSVAGWLLQEAGWELVGLFMRNGVRVAGHEARSKSCCSVSDARDARMVAEKLGIPFQAVDLGEEFSLVIRHFLDEYARGRTPNPCAVCNRDLKFDRLLALAEELGADGIATGHYAQIDVLDGRVHVRRGVDRGKDQSYQLFCVREEHLARAHLPLGALEKPRVRGLAGEAGLRTARKADSQEICFVPQGDYRKLLEERGVTLHPGKLVDTAGRVLGDHPGTEHFTIGQRRGHGIGGGVPLYVVDLLPESGTVVLGPREACSTGAMRVDELNWIGFEPPAGGFETAVQVRYHHRPVACRVVLEDPAPGVDPGVALARVATVHFETPEHAVTPGQGAAFYDGDRLLGGGWIRSTTPAAAGDGAAAGDARRSVGAQR